MHGPMNVKQFSHVRLFVYFYRYVFRYGSSDISVKSLTPICRDKQNQHNTKHFLVGKITDYVHCRGIFLFFSLRHN